MLVLPPPVKPLNRQETRQKHKKYYTIHENANNVLAFQGMLDNEKTTVLGFLKENDATRLGRMIEKHYIVHKEWPEMVLNGTIRIYAGPREEKGSELQFLHTVEWSPDEISLFFAARYMDIMQIDRLTDSDTGFNINGSKISMEGSHEFYTEACERLFSLANPIFNYMDEES